MFEFFIAKRYLRSKHKINFITIISIISTLGITLGVAALIIILSVFNGFGSLVTSILINFDPHIRMTVTSTAGYSSVDSVYTLLQSDKRINAFKPYAEGKVILLNRSTYEILTLKGESESINHENWGVKNSIISGDVEYLSDYHIIIGLPIALRLSCQVGDTISVVSAANIERSITSLAIPQTRKYIVAAIFESNNKDYDYSMVFTTLKSAQKLLGMQKKISGIEIRLHNIDDAIDTKEFLQSKLGVKNYSVYTWYDLHKDLYSVMLIERWSAYIILCLIIAVATFNILASLTMSVTEKRKDIGVLRSMGTIQKSILKIFMFEGILIGVIGTIAGTIIGFVTCYLQIQYNFYPLDPRKYIIDYLPVEMRVSDFIAVAAMALFLCFIAALHPAKKAARLSITESIKWE
ncbi:MAG: ABC transporter permease [bacterium]